jgi:hypothetical protein
MPKDSYEPSAPQDRKAFLEQIKKKVNNGFYSSEEVTEDLSESFARVFDRASES